MSAGCQQACVGETGVLMDANLLFGQALGLGDGWNVVRSEMDVEGRQLRLWLDFSKGAQHACPECGEYCPVHDTVEKRWRHLDFWQHQTELIARVPRVCCPEHGVRLAPVPWARAGSGFTLMMEAMILLLCQQMPVAAAARHLGENDKRLWRVLDHYVTKAHAARSWDHVRRIMIRRQGADLRGSLWSIRGNQWTRSQEQLAQRKALAKAYPVLGRAIGLREALQDVLQDDDLPSLRWWLGWAARSRLEPFRKLARTLKQHLHGILAYWETRLTNAAIEAINGILQMAKRAARGFRNFHYFRLAAYLKAGRLNLAVPHVLPT